MITLATLLLNKRKLMAMAIDTEGQDICFLDPGEELVLYTHNPNAYLAQFERIVFTDDEPFAEVTPRPGMPLPPESDKPMWPVTYNHRGRSPEIIQRLVNGKIIHIQRGVPVTVFVPFTDEAAGWSHVDCAVSQERMVKSQQHQGYLVPERFRGDVPHDRSDAELKILEEQLVHAEEDSQRLDAERPAQLQNNIKET